MKPPTRPQWKAFQRVGGLGLELVAYILIFLKIGQWLDAKYGTDPVWERIGLAVGIFAGFYSLWKVAKQGPPS